MQSIGAFQAKTHFSSLLEQVEKGERVVITKHGHPVAELIPCRDKEDRQKVKQAIQRLKLFAKTHTLGGIDWKALRDEGRR